MTDISKARNIGSRQAFIGITVGLAVAYLIMALIAGPMWLFSFDYAPTLIFAALVLYGIGYVFGGLAGKLIIIKKYPSLPVGLVSGFLITSSATFIGSLAGFFNEGLQDRSTLSEPFYDYILKPILAVSFWGFIPIAAIGVWFGWSIRRRAKHTNDG